MEKKQVLEILESLKPHRELAEWMIALIDAGFMDKDTYQNTLFMVTAAIKQMPESDEKAALKEKLEKLKEVSKKESSKKAEEDVED